MKNSRHFGNMLADWSGSGGESSSPSSWKLFCQIEVEGHSVRKLLSEHTDAHTYMHTTNCSTWTIKLSNWSVTSVVEVQCNEHAQGLFHDLLLRSYFYHCVWSVITAHNLTPEKRDNNYSPHPLAPTAYLRSTFKSSRPVVGDCNAHFKML